MALSIHDIKVYVPAKDFALSKRFYAALGFKESEVGAVRPISSSTAGGSACCDGPTAARAAGLLRAWEAGAMIPCEAGSGRRSRRLGDAGWTRLARTGGGPVCPSLDKRPKAAPVGAHQEPRRRHILRGHPSPRSAHGIPSVAAVAAAHRPTFGSRQQSTP